MVRFAGAATSQDVVSVLRMLDAEIHRGPNDWGVLYPDTIACDPQLESEFDRRGRGHDFQFKATGTVQAVLGARRLSILDLSERGRMPMGSADSRTWITYNGEIYNFRELRSELIQCGYEFRSDSDTEVLLHAYEQWGDAMLPRLRGMFACALLRTGGEPSLLIAKDRFGIKPLYYYADEERLLFASEVRSLMASGLVPYQTDIDAMVRFLQLGSVPLPLTSVRGVRALAAASALYCEKSRINIRKYWDLNRSFRANDSRVTAEHDMLTLLTDSVRAHSASDVPLGIFLSGGIDSSALVALASLAGQHPIKTVSVTFEEPNYDESFYAQLVAKKYGTEHGEVRLTRQDFFEEMPKLFAAMDQPTIDGVNTYFVSKAAKASGLTVVFAGTGADEIFLGYQHLQRAALLGRASGMMARIPGAVRRQVVRTAYNTGLPYGRREKLPYLNNPSRQNIYLLFRGLFGPQQIQQFLGITEREVRDVGAGILGCDSDSPPDFEDALVSLEFQHYLQNQLLKDTDFMSMSHSLEVRVPYLDNEVVDNVLSITPAKRLHGHMPKPLLVNALGERLPRAVWNRPKQGFSFPFGEWMRADPGLLEADVQTSRIFEPRSVQELWSQFRNGGVHWSRPWALSVLAHAVEQARDDSAWRPPSVAPVEVMLGRQAREDSECRVETAVAVKPRPAKGHRKTTRTKQQTILVLLSDLFDALGGIQTFNRSLVKALDCISATRGWNVELLVLNDSKRERCSSPYFHTDLVKYRSFQRNTTSFALAAVQRAHSATTAIIGHVNFCPVLPLMNRTAPSLYSIMVAHGIEVWKPLPWLQRWGVNNLDEVLTVSEFTRDEMRLHNHVNGLAFTTFPDTLDPFYGTGAAPDPRTTLGLPPGPMLLSVSRLDDTEFYKRIDLIVEAMPGVLKQCPEAFLVVVGEGTDRNRLEQLTAQLGIAGKVRFAGRVAEKELPLYYQACDIFVLPSLKEGFGIVFLEAMQYAKPCIGARAAAVPEVIVDGENGLLAAPGDPRSLQRAIEMLIKSPQLRSDMGRAGLRRLEARYSFDNFRNRLEEVLCRLPA